MNKALLLTIMIMSGAGIIGCNDGGDGATPQAAAPAPAPLVNPVDSKPIITDPKALDGAVAEKAAENADEASGYAVDTGELPSVILPRSVELGLGDASFVGSGQSAGAPQSIRAPASTEKYEAAATK